MTPPEEQDPRPEDLDPLPGRVIGGNFRIDALIGSGAMGNVYRGEQLSLGKAVAIKVLHTHLMGDEKLVMRFKREAKSASLLNHPHSVQIIDSGADDDGTLYIAMELLDGRDLAHVIRDEFPLPLPRVVHILSQVLEALDEAHAQGIVHRDLKPSNIMLIERRGERDFVKVCDFGIAKAMASDGRDEDRDQMLTIQGLVCGTPEYMAPEQARSEPLDGRADLYSTAVIMYQLLTGDIPFRADTPMGIVSRHLAEAPVPPSQRRTDLPIPKAIDDIVLRGMEKGREQRFPSARVFRDALRAAAGPTTGPLTPLPPSAMPTTPAFGSLRAPPTRAGDRPGSTADLPPRRASRMLRTFVAACVVGMVLGAVVFVLARRPPNELAPAAASSAPAPLAAAAPAPAAVAARVPEPEPLQAPPPAAEPADQAPPEHAGAAAAANPERAPLPASAAHDHSHRRRSGEHAQAPVPGERPAVPAPALAAAPKPAAAVATPPSAPAESPATRGPRDALAEGERLLGQGEAREACARGEEAKHLGPKVPAVYKFLGKCYMRAGDAGQANDNYKKYLELAPTASDAPFIKSIIK